MVGSPQHYDDGCSVNENEEVSAFSCIVLRYGGTAG